MGKKFFYLLFGFCTCLFAQEKFMNKEIVCLETTEGNIEIELMPSVAPKACENFLTLVKDHYYDGIIFHRVIKDFMVQTGDPTGTGRGGQSCWGKPFKDELRADIAFDTPGIVAMANAGPNTNGSQFFITTAKTPWLNMRHTIFGKVVRGYEVVDRLQKSATNPMDKPLEEKKILRAYIKTS